VWVFLRRGWTENESEETKVIANFDNSLANLQRKAEKSEVKIVPKVIPVKGGLVTNFGNVYFPKK